MKKICGNCEYTDGCLYTSLLQWMYLYKFTPKVKCTITNKFHFENDVCDVEFAPIKRGEDGQ